MYWAAQRVDRRALHSGCAALDHLCMLTFAAASATARSRCAGREDLAAAAAAFTASVRALARAALETGDASAGFIDTASQLVDIL